MQLLLKPKPPDPLPTREATMYTQVGKPHLHWLESGSPNVPKIWDGVVPAAITHSCILEVVVERSTLALKACYRQRRLQKGGFSSGMVGLFTPCCTQNCAF